MLAKYKIDTVLTAITYKVYVYALRVSYLHTLIYLIHVRIQVPNLTFAFYVTVYIHNVILNLISFFVYWYTIYKLYAGLNQEKSPRGKQIYSMSPFFTSRLVEPGSHMPLPWWITNWKNLVKPTHSKYIVNSYSNQ